MTTFTTITILSLTQTNSVKMMFLAPSLSSHEHLLSWMALYQMFQKWYPWHLLFTFCTWFPTQHVFIFYSIYFNVLMHLWCDEVQLVGTCQSWILDIANDSVKLHLYLMFWVALKSNLWHLLDLLVFLFVVTWVLYTCFVFYST